MQGEVHSQEEGVAHARYECYKIRSLPFSHLAWPQVSEFHIKPLAERCCGPLRVLDINPPTTGEHLYLGQAAATVELLLGVEVLMFADAVSIEGAER
jgi:hypothetical protein